MNDAHSIKLFDKWYVTACVRLWVSVLNSMPRSAFQMQQIPMNNNADADDSVVAFQIESKQKAANEKRQHQQQQQQQNTYVTLML